MTLDAGSVWTGWLATWGWPVLIVSGLVMGYGLGYFLVLQAWGHTWLTRIEPTLPDAGPPVSFYVLMGALNESLVISQTVTSLIAQHPSPRIVVVDDGSDDDTGQLAAQAGGQSVMVVRRDFPRARLGKGAALNDGLQHIERDIAGRHLDPASVIICVMDADGRLSEGTFAQVARLFADPHVGGVQLGVRIGNRGSLLTRLQDVGFWGTTVVAQLGRNLSGTVSLGGNGQFARLTALREVAGPRGPWSDSLTEDLDLTVSLQQVGWRTAAISTCWVVQEGPATVRALVRQRTRWAQGHMICAGRYGQLLASRELPSRGAAELGLYLFSPWLVTLAWSLLAPALLVMGAIGLWEVGATRGVGAAVGAGAGLYLLAFAPMVYSAHIYALRSADTGLVRALLLQHASLIMALVTYAATWRALWHILTRRRTWDKTARVGAAAAQLAPTHHAQARPAPARPAPAHTAPARPAPAREDAP